MKHTADALRTAFVELYESPNAYRPPTRVSHLAIQPPRSAAFILNRLSDLANEHGLTAGDAGVLSVEFMTSVDRHRSYPEGFNGVLDAVAEGDLLAVSGKPLRDFVKPDAVVAFLEAAAVATRPQAYGEYIDSFEEM